MKPTSIAVAALVRLAPQGSIAWSLAIAQAWSATLVSVSSRSMTGAPLIPRMGEWGRNKVQTIGEKNGQSSYRLAVIGEQFSSSRTKRAATKQ
jgi:hypothetical protein